MCGIVGFIGEQPAAPILLEGLSKLEYRGYDSAGIAVMDGGAVTCVKAKGRIANVESLLESRPHELSSHTGIGHTRWATHGAPSDENSHPHGTELVYAVHNGIIENYAELRERLAGLGYRFRSETDTEAAVCLIDYHYRQTGDPKEALAAATRELRGSWALGVLFADRDGELYAVRHENPLVAASDETGSYIASDITALLEHTDRYIRLDEDEIAVLCADGIRVYGADGAPVEKDQGNSKQNAAEAAFTEFNNTADTTAEFDSKDIADNKGMAVLAYIGILFLIPLLAAPNSRFARFHANQGLVLFLAEVVLGAAGGVLGLIPFVGWIISGAIGIVCLAFMIIGIVNAANGKAKELPLIGSFKLIK